MLNHFRKFVIMYALIGASFGASAQEVCSDVFTGIQFVESPYLKISEVKTGRLETRLSELLRKYPNNMTLMKDVNIVATDSGSTWQGHQNLLVISTQGMNAEQLYSLRKDYLEYLSYGTMSYPLASGGGHLYTRFGMSTFDLINSLTVREYNLSSGVRLETFVELSSLEQAQFTKYLLNATANKDAVLGNFSYTGAQVSNGKLNDNRPCSGGHNCTSWIATAPIGADGKNLMDILNVPNSTEHDYGTNPGWWTGYLNTQSKSHKVPFAVYMSSEQRVEQITSTILENGRSLSWNFNFH